MAQGVPNFISQVLLEQALCRLYDTIVKRLKQRAPHHLARWAQSWITGAFLRGSHIVVRLVISAKWRYPGCPSTVNGALDETSDRGRPLPRVSSSAMSLRYRGF